MGVLAGIGRETSKTQGGIYDVYVAQFPSITGVTSASAGIATFHCTAGAFKHFQVSKEAGSNLTWTDTINIANGSSQVETVMVMNFKRNQVAKRNEAKVLAQSELVFIVNDNDIPLTGGTVGNLYILGLQVDNDFGGADATSIVGATGGQFADANSMVVTLRALESHPPLSITEANYAAIIAGTAI